MEFRLEDVLHSIRPKAAWCVRNGKELEWRDKEQIEPTEEEIEEGRKKLEAKWVADEYKRLRRKKYPSIEECVHAILDDNLEALQVKRKAVKDKYPKPEAPSE
tara:strand:+ start:637 stop:945 length:309 start_codon:yes stop_codon:yes gene_type:complete